MYENFHSHSMKIEKDDMSSTVTWGMVFVLYVGLYGFW